MQSVRIRSLLSLSIFSRIICCASVALLVAAIAPVKAVAQITNWPEFQFGNNRLGFNPYEVVLGPSTVGNLGLLWQSNQGHNLIILSPAVVDGLLYGATFGEGGSITSLFAINVGTGAIARERPLVGQFFLSSPTILNGVLYIGVGLYIPYYTGAMYALNARTGALLWSNPNVNAIQAAPVVGDGAVYFGSIDGNIYALDANSGNLLWVYATNTGSGTGSAAALVNGILYQGMGDFIFALNASSGTLLWRYQMTYFTSAAPAVENGVVYTSSYDGGVYALNANTGTLLWRVSSNSLYFSALAVANGKVYACGSQSALGLAALDEQTGSTVWSQTAVQCKYASPIVANGVVYVGTQDGHAAAYNASNGTLLWQEAVGTQIDATPVVVNGMLYIATYDGNVLAFKPNGHHTAGTDYSSRK